MRADARGALKAARRVAVLIAALLLIAFGRAEVDAALLERTGFNVLADAAEEACDMDVRSVTEKLLSGELRLNADVVVRWLRRVASSVRSGLMDALCALAAPALASLACKALLGERSGGDVIGLLCRVAGISLLVGRFVEARAVCAAALDETLRLTDAAAPVLVSAMTLTGSIQPEGILTPSATLCADLIETLLRDRALPFCSIAAVMAASANLSDRFRLNRLFELARDTLQRGVKLLLSGFVGLLALQGVLAGGSNPLSMRAIRRAIQSALPIIGGEVSDSAGALLASALAVRSFAGAAGVLALLGASFGPILRLASGALSLRLASAALEPLADRCMARIACQFADLSRMLLAICVGGTLLSVLTLGACLSFSGR